MKQFHTKINKIFQPLRRLQIFTIFLSMVRITFMFTLLIQVQKTIDTISMKNLVITQAYLQKCGIMIILFFFANCIFQYFFRNLQYTSHYALIKSLFGLVLEKKISFHEEYSSSSLLSIIKEDSKFISDWKSTGVITILANFTTMTVILLIMIHYNVIITIIIFCAILLCFGFTHYISKFISLKTYDLQVSNTELNQKIIDYINGIKVIKQFKKEAYFLHRLEIFIDHNTYKHSKCISQYYSVFTSIYAMLTTALPVLTILIGVILILNNQYTIGKLIVTYALVENLQEPVLNIPEFLNQRRQALAVQNKILPILQIESIYYPVKKLNVLNSFTFHSGGFSFKDDKIILKNINLDLNKGDIIIIKGESGKGKSTLVNLISRFQETVGQSIIIKYNEIPIETILPSEYYSHVLQAPQTPYIFGDTIIDNITLRDNYTSAEFDEVIYAACLEEFILTKGKNYLLEHNGNNISGGQKQRIGLARVLLRKPDLLMLDEPISALDPELVNTITKRVSSYCERYQIGLVIISHNDSFEKYYKRLNSQNVTILSL